MERVELIVAILFGDGVSSQARAPWTISRSLVCTLLDLIPLGRRYSLLLVSMTKFSAAPDAEHSFVILDM